MNFEQHITTAKKRPVLTGVLAILAVMSTGGAIAFGSGMTAPQMAEAFVSLPPCCVVVPPPVIVPPPPVVVVPPPVVIEKDSLPPCCETVPPVITTPPPTQTPTPNPVVVEPEPVVIVPPPYVPPVEVPEVIDVCPNISGIQASIPSGMTKVNGDCVTPPPFDECPNIPGNQPMGTDCYPDACPNIPGQQPAGTDCYPDACPNIPGQQPAGYECNPPVVVEVPECILDAMPKQIDRGERTRLNWSTVNASSISIDNGVGQVSAVAFRDLYPTQTTTYTLTATGNGRTVNCYTTVVVRQPQPEPVCTLTASPATINRNGTSILNWTTQNATSVSINQGIGAVSVNGSRPVTPTATTNYTLTATGNGKTVNCYATVTVVYNPELPVCTLTAFPTTINQGSAATLSWTTDNATSVSINQGIGQVNLDGSRSVMPTQTTTYVLTATGPDGTVNCDKTITVIPPQPENPVCTLDAHPIQITRGGSTTLTWTTDNATTVSIDNGIGQVNLDGSRTVAPQATTKYILTATGNGKTVYCDETITVIVIQDAPVCTLTAVPTTINQGSAATLTWTTDNATSVSINQGIGQVNLDGSRSVMPTQTTQYKLTATGNGKTVDCYATITVIPPAPKLPVCTLSISPSSVTKGDSATLVWNTQNANAVSIDQGIGQVSLDGSRTVTPSGTTRYVLTATGDNGATVNCDATITVTEREVAPTCYLRVNPSEIDEGDRATITWGGTNIRSVRISEGVGSVGASGSTSVRPREGRYTYVGTFTTTKGDEIRCSDTLRVKDDDRSRDRDRDPEADLAFLPFADDEPLAFVYLSDMPYTGLDMGPLGTALYWTMLVLWSAAAAYLVIFNAVPMALRKMQGNQAHSYEAHAEVSHAPHTTHQVMSVAAPAPVRTDVARSYSSYEGFRSFAKDNGALTIDDLVSGLAREEAPAPRQAAPAPAAVAYAAPLIAPTYAPLAEVRMEAPAPAAEAKSDDVTGFLAALLAGDKDGAFGAIRNVTRSGGDSEEFLTQAVCALDEAYRSRIDGTNCHPEIARLTKDCAPTFLERLVGSLTTAVDGTYSAGVTGVKLAVTRALSIVNG